MTREQTEAQYRRYIDCLNERRLAEAGAFYADRLLYNGRWLTRTEWREEAIEGSFVAMPDLHWRIERLVVEGDVLAAQLIDTGTLVEPWQGVAATGRACEFGENVFYRYEDGLIVEVRSIIDIMAMQSV